MEAEILLKIKAAEVALPESLRVPDDLDHLSAADVKIWLTAATGHLLKEIRLRKVLIYLLDLTPFPTISS